MNPLLMLSIFDRRDNDYYSMNNDGSFSAEDSSRSLMDIMYLSSMQSEGNFDYTLWKLLQGNRYKKNGLGAYELAENNDNFMMLAAMQGLSGPIAGSGIATGDNTMLPYLMLDGGFF